MAHTDKIRWLFLPACLTVKLCRLWLEYGVEYININIVDVLRCSGTLQGKVFAKFKSITVVWYNSPSLVIIKDIRTSIP